MNLFKSIVLAVFFGGVFMLAPKAWAATAYLVPDFQTVAVDDIVAVGIYLDTQGMQPNTIEGQIYIDPGSEKIDIAQLSMAGSVLDFWPQNPSLDNSSLITFTGGTPGGFNQSDGLLFKIVFKAKREGQVVFSPANFKAYNNDANATPLGTTFNPLTINILPKVEGVPQDQWLDVISNDNQPPQGLTATIGQDSRLFDGRKFITILATDDQSGLDYFEVKEGDYEPARTGETYVLLDQTESVPIIISAYDKAGNVSRILLTPTAKVQTGPKVVLSWVTLIVVIALMMFIIFNIIKKKKNKKSKIA